MFTPSSGGFCSAAAAPAAVDTGAACRVAGHVCQGMPDAKRCCRRVYIFNVHSRDFLAFTCSCAWYGAPAPSTGVLQRIRTLADAMSRSFSS